MKRLLIDVNSIVHGLVTGRISGIGRTTLELVKALEELEDLPFELTLYSQNMKGIGSTYFSDKFKKSHYYLPNRAFFNKVLGIFPIREMVRSCDLMHIPHNWGHVNNPEKLILTLHDALFMKMEEKLFAHDQMRIKVPKLAQKAKGIITCSESSKKDIIETMGIEETKIKVIPWGYDKATFKINYDTEFCKNYLLKKFNISNPFFFSISCNAERKNTHKLVLAYLEYLKKEPINDLVLVWPDVPNWLKDQVDTCDLGNRVHFLNYISDEELAIFLNVSTSLFFISSYEGFGLPILEALACACPVVTLKNSSLPEVGGDAVVYLEDINTESIIAGFEFFENNHDYKKINEEQSLNQARKFDWSFYAKEYISYIDSLIR
jgi:glycosyltransferase involved in cell wall biosynthesis